MAPIDVGLDMSMFAEGAIDAQLLSFEDAKDFGVYIYKWEQVKCRGEVAKARAYVTRMPRRRHAREVVLMLWKKHFSLVKNFGALMGQKAETSVKVTKSTRS